MSDPGGYAAERATLLRDDWQFSRIFSAPMAKRGFTALLALRAEMQEIKAGISDPGIAAVKFEWWRTELERGFSNEAQHPVARAIGQAFTEVGGSAEYCQELVDAAETEYNIEAMSAQDFRLYLYRSGGVIAEQLVVLHGSSERRELDAARALGELKRFSDLLRVLNPMLRSGRWLFPQQWLQQFQLEPATALDDDSRASELLAAMLAELDRERIAARTALEGIRLPPALALQWTLAQRDYRKLRAISATSLLQAELHDGPLRRLWTAWRGARTSLT